jgi:hypothetical protein
MLNERYQASRITGMGRWPIRICALAVLIGLAVLYPGHPVHSSSPIQAASRVAASRITLAPAIAAAPRTEVARGRYYTRTVQVHWPAETLWLASTPDGQGDLCTDDRATITIVQNGQQVGQWSHQFAPAAQQGITCLPAQNLTDLVPPGDYLVTIALDDLFPDTYGSQPYYLVMEEMLDDAASVAAPSATMLPHTPTPTSSPTAAPGGTATTVPVPTITPSATAAPASGSAGTVLAGPSWLLPTLMGGGLLLGLAGIILLARRPAPHRTATTLASGIVYLYDQEIRQAHTAVVHGQRLALYRHPLRLVPEPDAGLEPPLAHLSVTEQGMILQEEADTVAQPLPLGSTGTVAQGTVTVQYQA